MIVVIVAALVGAVKIVLDALSPARQWARQAREGDPVERQHAAMMLGMVAGTDASAAIPALIEALDDPDEQVAVTAVWSLAEAIKGARGERDREAVDAAISALIGTLGDPSPEVRFAAFGALNTSRAQPSQMGEALASAWSTAVDAALIDPSELIRLQAVKATGTIGSMGQEPPPEVLMRMLVDDPNPQVRVAVAWAISAFRGGRDRTTLVLLDALESGSPEVRSASDGALRGMEGRQGPEAPRRSSAIVPDLVEALGNDDPLVASHAAATLKEIGTEAEASIPALLGMLGRPFDPEAAVVDNRPQFTEHQADPAYQAALALGAIAPGSTAEREVIDALAALIEDRSADRYRRGAAAEGLGQFDPRLIETTLPILLSAMEEASEIGGPPTPQLCFSVGCTAPILADPNEAIAALTEALGWVDAKVEAANALARFGARAGSALPRLRELTPPSEIPWVREAALKAIEQIERELAGGGPG